MLLITKKDKRTALDKEITSVLEIMSLLRPDSKEYTAMVNNLETLYKAKPVKGERKVPWDIIVSGAFSILGMLMITHFEKTDVITSKAFGWIHKGRV